MRRALVVLGQAACIVFAVMFLLVVFVDHGVAYYLDNLNATLLPNVALVLIIACVAACVWFLRRRLRASVPDSPVPGNPAPDSPVPGNPAPGTSTWIDRHYRSLSLVLPAFVLVYLLGVYASVHFTLGWDVAIVSQAAIMPVSEWDKFAREYFSAYTNNLFIVWLFSAIASAATRVLPSINPVTVFAAVACVISAVSCLLFMRAAEKIMGSRRWAFVASILYVLLVGISPWALVPYSDTLGLFFCMALLWCFACGQNLFTRWALPAFLAAIGVAIKPTVMFAFVAWLVARLMVSGSLRGRAKQVGLVALCAGAGLALGLACVRVTTEPYRAELDADAQFSLSHYVMMGLNEKTDGFYSPTDVKFSKGQPDVATREQANWEVARERLAAFGPAGLAEHLLHKLLINLNDGTFAWGMEGRFYGTSFVEDFPTSPIVADYYMTSGTMRQLFCTVQKALWFVTLAGVPLVMLGLGALADSARSRELALIATMLASLLALMAFLLMCEPRARYLYLYGGYFVLLSTWGYKQLSSRLAG